MYYERIIDQYLSEWAARPTHKPVLLRGARQVGKSTAIRHLGEQFKYFVEINLEKQSEYKALFLQNIDVKRIVPQMRMCQNRHILFLISFISSLGPGIMLDCWFSFSAIFYPQMSRDWFKQLRM